MFTDDDLKDFVDYTQEFLKGLKADKNVKVDPEEEKALKDLTRQIIAMYYNAMVFESYVMSYAAGKYLLENDLSQLPLHINDDGLVSRAIVKWRLERNK